MHIIFLTLLQCKLGLPMIQLSYIACATCTCMLIRRPAAGAHARDVLSIIASMAGL